MLLLKAGQREDHSNAATKSWTEREDNSNAATKSWTERDNSNAAIGSMLYILSNQQIVLVKKM